MRSKHLLKLLVCLNGWNKTGDCFGLMLNGRGTRRGARRRPAMLSTVVASGLMKALADYNRRFMHLAGCLHFLPCGVR